MRVLSFALVLALIGLLTWTSPQLAQEKTKPRVSQEKKEVIKKETEKKDAEKQDARKRTPLVQTAKAFLESLDEQQLEKAQLDYDAESRVGWHFIPMETRKGVPLRDMTAEQKERAMELLKATVSQMGYDKATTIMQLEGILLKLEGPSSEGRRDPEKYYFTIFGKPAPKQKWGLSIEGHHLSLNFVAEGSKFVDSTPQFFASNPAKLHESYGDEFPKGMQVLKAEEQLAFTLINSLDEKQLAAATLPGETPSEIRGAGEPQPPNTDAHGVTAENLSAEQQETLKKLMRAYTGKMRPAVAKERWAAIDEAGFSKVHFAWSGAKKPGVGHYYVVQGPSFVIEFINVQPDAAGNPANHVHCVWRDMQGDFDLPIASK